MALFGLLDLAVVGTVALALTNDRLTKLCMFAIWLITALLATGVIP